MTPLVTFISNSYSVMGWVPVLQAVKDITTDPNFFSYKLIPIAVMRSKIKKKNI